MVNIEVSEAARGALKHAIEVELRKILAEREQACDDLAAARRYAETVEGEARRVAADMVSLGMRLVRDLNEELEALCDVLREVWVSKSAADLWIERMTETHGHCEQ